MSYSDFSRSLIEECVAKSYAAFSTYSQSTLATRNQLLHAIASELEKQRSALVAAAALETNLPEARLNNELNRTIFQLESYGDACERGYWLEASIDQDTSSQPVKPVIKKHMIPMGPVVVYGSSNFPFAYSTAGGDTASALAAGCTVIVKAHPAHPKTSSIAASCIEKAITTCQLQSGIFAHVYGASFQVGEWLVKHPLISAVAFTGSYTGGKQLFDWAAQRAIPVPVFAEMGSVNPVFLLSEKLEQEPTLIAAQLSASYTLGVGQFCTKPGLLIGMESEALNLFCDEMIKLTKQIQPSQLLHAGIEHLYRTKSEQLIAQKGVELIAQSEQQAGVGEGQPLLTRVTASDWLENKLLHQENFGPYTQIIVCKNYAELLLVAQALEGQLTCTLMATVSEAKASQELIRLLEQRCGRLIFNGVPTGVEVCKSMHHGGPFPATTDSRFGAVGADAIKRFIRPLAYQNWPEELLPDYLQDNSLTSIPRYRNGVIE